MGSKPTEASLGGIWELYEPATKREIANVYSLRAHALDSETVSVEGFLDAQNAEVRVRGPQGKLIFYEIPERATMHEILTFQSASRSTLTGRQ